jgi:hypothetical protein
VISKSSDILLHEPPYPTFLSLKITSKRRGRRLIQTSSQASAGARDVFFFQAMIQSAGDDVFGDIFDMTGY